MEAVTEAVGTAPPAMLHGAPDARTRFVATCPECTIAPMKPDVFLVGGAVRDTLLGLPVVDRDWVVVGGTPEAMVAAGYRPVGQDFPVFLHPETHEEYALARTERKSGPGYRGFVVASDPSVTLEEDLSRRDLTVNAIAMDEAGGRSTRTAGGPTSSIACSATSRTPSSRTPCGCCASPASWRASPPTASPSPRRRSR